MAQEGSSARDRILRRRALLLASTLSGVGGVAMAQQALADPPQGTAQSGAAELASLPYAPGSFVAQQQRLSLWPCKASTSPPASAEAGLDASLLEAPAPAPRDEPTDNSKPGDSAKPDKPAETVKPGNTAKPDNTNTKKPNDSTNTGKPNDSSKSNGTGKPDNTTKPAKPDETSKPAETAKSNQTTTPGGAPNQQPQTPPGPKKGTPGHPTAAQEQAIDQLFDLLRRARAGERDSTLRVRIGEIAERVGYRALAYLAYEAAVRCGHQPKAPLLDRLALLSGHLALLNSSHQHGVVVFPAGVHDRREVFYLVPNYKNLVDAGHIDLRTQGAIDGLILQPGQEGHAGTIGRPQVCLSPPPPPPRPDSLRFGIAGGPFAYASATSDPLVNGYFEVAALLHIPAGESLSVRPMLSVTPGINAFGFSVLADAGAQLQFHASDSFSISPSFRAGYRYMQDGAPTLPQNHISIAAPYLRPELALSFRIGPVEAGGRLGGLITPERAPDGSERWGRGPIAGLWLSYLFGSNDDDLVAYHPTLSSPIQW